MDLIPSKPLIIALAIQISIISNHRSLNDSRCTANAALDNSQFRKRIRLVLPIFVNVLEI